MHYKNAGLCPQKQNTKYRHNITNSVDLNSGKTTIIRPDSIIEYRKKVLS